MPCAVSTSAEVESRTVAITCQPAARRRIADAKPMPDEAPVIRIAGADTSGFEVVLA